MIVFGSKLLGRETVADRTLACRFECPDGFSFQAGQYLDLTLLDPTERDAEGPLRSFSIASAPSEPELLILMRMRDTAFKRVLAALPLGTEVMLEGPAGDFVLDADRRHPLVFIAGGVGLAPFLSMLRETVRTGCPLGATLFYSNRRPEDSAYLEELQALEGRLRGFTCIATMTRMPASTRPWAGETGYLDRTMLERHLPALCGPRYYIAGSPMFIATMRREIENAGVPDQDIRIELFSGY